MEFRIAKDEFIQGLSRVQSVIEKKTTLPILSNVLLETKTDAIRITGTDLEVGVKGTYPAEIVTEGAITVPAKKLFEIVREMPESELTLKVIENDRVEITSGRADFKIAGISIDDYPILPDYEKEEFFEIPTSFLIEMIEKVSHAVGNDDTRPFINGVFMQTAEVEGNKYFRMVATDGHRLAVSEKPLPEESAVNLDAGAIVPRKGVFELKKSIVDDDEPIQICFTERNVILRKDSLLFIIRLIDGTFPEYNNVIPASNNRILTISRDELYAVIRRVSLLAEESNLGVKFAFAKKVVTISCDNPSLGQAREELAVTYDGEEFDIGFNARYFLDALTVVQDEDVTIAFDVSTAPVLIKAPSDPGFKAVLMPMRL